MSIIQSKFTITADNCKIYYAWFEALHTRIDIILIGAPKNIASKVVDELYLDLCDFEKVVNRFDSKSELSFINTNAKNGYVKISKQLYDIISKGIEGYNSSQGYFDITIQSFTTIQNAIKCILLDSENSAIHYTNNDLQIDLNGIAKGYALDLAVSKVKENGFIHFLLNFGNSSIAAFGNQPYGEGWKISTLGELKEYRIVDQFLTLSGNASDLRSHIINPHTHQLIEGKDEVAVLTNSGVEGEIQSTATFARKGEHFNEI